MIFTERDMWCDGCGVRGRFSKDGEMPNQKELRRRAAANGWRRRKVAKPSATGILVGRPGDFCTACCQP